MPARGREIEHGVGAAVGEREAIVGDQRVEIPVPQERHHHRGRTGREPHRLRQALLLDAEQFAERAVLAGRLVERARVLGIVQMQEVDLVDP